MKFPTSFSILKTFDRGIKIKCNTQMPDRLRYWDYLKNTKETHIPRGSGLSYSAASFEKKSISISHLNFNRIISFDSEKKLVEVESGLLLRDLFLFLLGKNLYMPIQPGFSEISVGGCIAANVHGKNQKRDGNFINQVESITLFHPSHGIIFASRQVNADVFYLTCGGFGLSGNILTATLRATPAPALEISLKCTKIKIGNLIEASSKENSEVDFCYSWHNFSTPSKNFAEGLLFSASLQRGDTSKEPPRINFPELKGKYKPFLIQNKNLWNKSTTRIFNWLYKTSNTWSLGNKEVSLYESLYPIEKNLFYYQLFGRNGFHEYQAIIPTISFLEYVDNIRVYLQKNYIPITLASSKFFSGNESLLNFSGNGICMALNFPRSIKSLQLCEFLDQLVIRLDGKPNIIKDSRLPQYVVDACYPEAEMFRRRLHEFDPKKIYRSELSTRLGL